MGVVHVAEVVIAIAAIIHGITYAVKFTRWIKQRPEAEVLPSIRVRDIVLGVFWALVCAVIWSLSYVSLSYVSKSVDPIEINVIMLFWAGCFLGVAYLLERGRAALFGKPGVQTQEVPVNWRTVAPWLAIAGNLLNFVLFVYALKFVSASQAMTLGETSPVFVALLTWMWLRRPLPGTTFAATGLAFVGAVLIVASNDFAFPKDSGETVGSVLALAGGFGFALFGTSLEKMGEVGRSRAGRLGFMAVVFLISFGVVAASAYLGGQRLETIDSFSMALLVLNGLRVAVVYVLYGVAVRYIGALLASILVTLEAFFTMFWDSRLLQHRPLPKLLIGAGVILLAAFTLALDKWRSTRGGPRPPDAGAAIV